MNSSSFSFQGDLLQKVIDVMYENDFSFKLLILMGAGGVEMLSNTYTAYLAYMANRFKDEPMIFGYDLYNEPTGTSEDTQEVYAIAEKCASWYDAIKQNAPSHFVTMGYIQKTYSTGILKYCPLTLFHFIYIRNHTNWMITSLHLHLKDTKFFFNGFPNHSINLIILAKQDTPELTIFRDHIIQIFPRHDIIPYEADQANFADSSLKYTKWYGNIGYSWWYYKDVSSFWPDTVWAYENYYGIVKLEYYTGAYEEIYKPPTANVFINYDPNSPCNDCNHPNDTLYHNPNPVLFDSLLFSGTITSDGINGIENVLILAEIVDDDTVPESIENSYAITNSEGKYSIYTSFTSTVPGNVRIFRFKCSYPSGDSLYRYDWEGVTIPQNIILQDLNPSLLPPEPNNETLVIETGDTVIWDNLQSLPYKEIIIEPGAQLNVLADTYLNKDAKIIVQRGGELIIDGGGLIGSCMWKGIEVWGNAALSQSSDEQGLVKIINEGKIENATVAIRTCKIDVDPNRG